jgi:hypothetical protein
MRHADDENVHPRGRAEAGSTRGAKTRAPGDAARDRRGMTTTRRAATLESAFGEITNRYVRSRGDGRAATESKARLVGRRAAALLVDPTGLSETIAEVEEWAAALNDRDVRDGPDHPERRTDAASASEDEDEVVASEEASEDEDEDASEDENASFSSRAAELAKMRQVLEISSRVREMCDARTAELEATRAELREAERNFTDAEASRVATEERLASVERDFLASRLASDEETKALRAALADAETAAVVEASTFSSKEVGLKDALREMTLERDRARAGLRDAEMELQALVIEGEAGAGAAEAAAAACDAAAAAEAETSKLRDQLANARLELRLARAESRGRADENEVLADELAARTARSADAEEAPRKNTQSSQTEEEPFVFRGDGSLDDDATEKDHDTSQKETSKASSSSLEEKSRVERSERAAFESKLAALAATVRDANAKVAAAESAAAEASDELAARRLGDAAAERQKRSLERQIDVLKARVGELEAELATARSEALESTASEVSEAVAALEAGHVEALRAMEREVESARAEAAAAETAAAASASAAENSALSADAAFEEARRARMDFVDARDEAERLECLLEEEKRAKARAETRDAEAKKPVTLHVTVVDDTAVCLTTVVQGVYDESDLEKARREASERATESTTALMESALESAVHIAREEAAAERDKALADSAKTHVAALEAAVVSARAEATASARAATRAALEDAEAAMREEIRISQTEYSDEARVSRERAEATEAALATATREFETALAASANEHEREVERLRESLRRAVEERRSISERAEETETALARCRSELADAKANAIEFETKLAEANAARDAARDDAAAKDAELAEYAARAMLHRDFSVSPSPIRAVDVSPFERKDASEGASFRASRRVTERRDSVSASAATPMSSADEAKRSEDDARALDQALVIEELKATLAEAYERERALESALAEAKATDASRAGTQNNDADADADADVSFSVKPEKPEKLWAFREKPEKPEEARPSSETSSPQVREKLRRSVAELDRLRARIADLTHEASYEQTVSAASPSRSAGEDSFARALGGAGRMERSVDISQDVSAYHDAPTPESVRMEERKMLRLITHTGAGPFAASEPRLRFDGFSPTFGAATATPYERTDSAEVSLDVSSASTPPDYDARRFASLLKRGEEEVRKLKARVAAFERAGTEE